MAHQPSSMVVDDTLLRRIARDAAVYSLTRPWALVMWIVLAAALAVSILGLTTAGTSPDPLTSWMPIAVVALGGYAVWLTVASARRAVRAAMPAGSTVWVQPGESALRTGIARRVSEIPYSTFHGMRVGRDALLLKVRGASAVTAFPLALFSDEDLARLRSRIHAEPRPDEAPPADRPE